MRLGLVSVGRWLSAICLIYSLLLVLYFPSESQKGPSWASSSVDTGIVTGKHRAGYLERDPEFSLADVPPRGWNSYDGFTCAVNESQFLANAEYQRDHLKRFGYRYVVVDFLWFRNLTDGRGQGCGWDVTEAPDYIDEYGRPIPDPERWPSSVNGQGFRPIADKVHAMGMLFGLHVMRGVSRAAVDAARPILGGPPGVTTADIVRPDAPCVWMPTFLGLRLGADERGAAARAYVSSLYRQYAEWGVDFVKHDCVFGTRDLQLEEIGAVSQAIVNSGRPMVYSLSPGYQATPALADSVGPLVNMFRVTDDDWDEWPHLAFHFDVARDFAGHLGMRGLMGKSWPDLDMLPFGMLSRRASASGPVRPCQLTQSEQVMQMTLWAVARSPLMFGGDLRVLDGWTKALLTNRAVLDINEFSTGNRQLWEADSILLKHPGECHLSMERPAASNRSHAQASAGAVSYSLVPYRKVHLVACPGVPDAAIAAVTPTSGSSDAVGEGGSVSDGGLDVGDGGVSQPPAAEEEDRAECIRRTWQPVASYGGAGGTGPGGAKWQFSRDELGECLCVMEHRDGQRGGRPASNVDAADDAAAAARNSVPLHAPSCAPEECGLRFRPRSRADAARWLSEGGGLVGVLEAGDVVGSSLVNVQELAQLGARGGAVERLVESIYGSAEQEWILHQDGRLQSSADPSLCLSRVSESDLRVWVAEDPRGTQLYVAFFNLSPTAHNMSLHIGGASSQHASRSATRADQDAKQGDKVGEVRRSAGDARAGALSSRVWPTWSPLTVGSLKACHVEDLWSGTSIGVVRGGTMNATVEGHGARLFGLSCWGSYS
eukprot:jgi/Mesvir1/4240/Mv22210-RA.1